MKTLSFLIQKEFLQIFRNRAMLPIIFAIPIVQLIIIVHAATFELKMVKMYVVDNDRSTVSRNIINTFQGSKFFRITGYTDHYLDGENSLRKDQSDAVMVIPRGFEKSLGLGQKASLQVVVNAINGMAGGLINGYMQSVINDYNKTSGSALAVSLQSPVNIETEYSFWYNPELDYAKFMVPGILVLLVTIISLLLSGMNIVREKEIGTIEQINVTPIKKYQFILGKLIPTLCIAIFELSFGLTIGYVFFQVPVSGSLVLLFGVAIVYISVILGLGLLFSTITHTQQQAMFVSFFFMLVFILMSGLFTPIENMPDWAQWVDRLNPVAHFIRIIRMILLKGSGFADIRINVFYLLGLALLSLGFAIRQYRKTA